MIRTGHRHESGRSNGFVEGARQNLRTDGNVCLVLHQHADGPTEHRFVKFQADHRMGMHQLVNHRIEVFRRIGLIDRKPQTGFHATAQRLGNLLNVVRLAEQMTHPTQQDLTFGRQHTLASVNREQRHAQLLLQLLNRVMD